MKIGDLVKLSAAHATPYPALVVDLVDKRCWRTDILGNKIDWNKVEPEPHAVVVIDGEKRTIPITDLELLDESR